MPLFLMRSLRRRGLALVLLIVLSGSCASNEPQAQLARVLKNTLQTSFAYEFSLQTDQALPGLGPEAEQARLFLQGLNITGQRAAERHSFAVSVLGIDAFDVISLDEDTLFLRFGFDELAKMLGEGDSSAQIVPLLRQRGLSDEAISAVAAAFRGEWIGVEGRVEPAELQAAFDSGETEPTGTEGSGSWREALGGDVDGFVERYVVVRNAPDGEDEGVFEIALRVRDLVRAVAGVDPTSQVDDMEADLEGLPELAPGTVTARDGVVTNVVVDLAEPEGAAGQEAPGTGRLRLDASQHGEVAPLEPPPGALTITDEQFLEALGAVSGLVEELAPPPPPVPAR